MKFEEVMPLMREGKKARMASNTDGEYWICGKIGNPDFGLPMQLTIIRMDKDNCALCSTRDWAIERWAIMAEDWEIVEE